MDNGDFFTLLDEMVWQAVETLALEPYRIPKDDTDAPVGRARSATSRVALVVVPFLMDRADELQRLRPAYITAHHRRSARRVLRRVS